MAVAVDVEGILDIIPFKLVMDLLMQYGVSLTLTWWVAGALLERTVVCSLETDALFLIISQWAYHKDHRFRRSPSMSTPKAWQS